MVADSFFSLFLNADGAIDIYQLDGCARATPVGVYKDNVTFINTSLLSFKSSDVPSSGTMKIRPCKHTIMSQAISMIV